MNNKILDKEIEKLVIYDAKNKKELAVITHENVDTASPEIQVKIKPKVKKDYVKGIILPIYLEDKFIGNIIIDENFEVTSGLSKGYEIKGLK